MRSAAKKSENPELSCPSCRSAMRLRWNVPDTKPGYDLRQFGCACGLVLNDRVAVAVPAANDN
jgi:hypothetical protein